MKLTKNYLEERTQVFEAEGTRYPGVALVQMELLPGYERAQKRLLAYIRSVNEAHLVMLSEQNIITSADAAIIMRALETIDYASYTQKTYSGKFEDLYFEIEDEIIRQTNGVGGNLHLARSRNDMCVAWSHMAIRDDILSLMNRVIHFQNTVLLFAEEHKNTIYAIHTHTQHAQPGLLGHYFLGVVDVLDRGVTRLQAAYDATNCSPMGAAAVTTSGFPVSRERVAELTGFDRVIENSYDAIGNCEYFTGTASAMGLLALDLGRVVTDLLLWATEEEKMIRLADGYISTSSIMPQKRNPIALEHLRSSLSMVKGLSDAVMIGFLKSPYGDISDYEDIEDTMSGTFDLLNKNLDLFNAVMATMDVNKQILEERVHESFSVVTEIADQMVRSYAIPFRQAHHFVARMVKKADRLHYGLRQISPAFFEETFEEVFGRKFEGDFAPILQSMDPHYFVQTREVLGGTGSQAMENMIASGRQKVANNQAWLVRHQEALAVSDKKRMEQVEFICKGTAD
ncbi:MAG: argininosuccinate lyase [Clostridia bacterium]